MEWISVKDRMPDIDREVVVYREDGSTTVDCLSWLDDEGAWFSYCRTEGFFTDVTHWQPLPDPPVRTDTVTTSAPVEREAGEGGG